MSYYLEIWLRGFAKRFLRSVSEPDGPYHPHITLVRPFKLADEYTVQRRVVDVLEGRDPIPFTLQGHARFDPHIDFMATCNDEGVLALDADLEQALANVVDFYPKLDDEKTLHATIHPGADFDPSVLAQPIEQYVLRVTAIRDHKIWFSYDLVTGSVLDREMSLDNDLWHETYRQFQLRSGLTASPGGFVPWRTGETS